MPLKGKSKKKAPFVKTRTLDVPKGFEFENVTQFKRKGKRKVGIAFSKKLTLKQSKAILKKRSK